MIFNNYFTLMLFLSSSHFFVDGLEDIGGIIRRKISGGWRHITSAFKQTENRKPENRDSESINFESTDSYISDSGSVIDTQIIGPESINPVEVPLAEVLEDLDQSSKTCVEDDCKEYLETIRKLQSAIKAKQDEIQDEIPIIHKGQRRTVSLKSADDGDKNKILEFLSNMMKKIKNGLIRIKDAIVRFFTRKKKPNESSTELNNANKDGNGQQSQKTPGGISTPGNGIYTPGTGSSTPDTGLYTAGTGSSTPETGLYTPGTGIFTPGTTTSGTHRPSYYGNTQENMNSETNHPVGQMPGNMNSPYGQSGPQAGNGNDVTHPSNGEAIPHQNMNLDEFSRRVQIAEQESDEEVDGQLTQAVIDNFWIDNFKPCDEKEAGRIIGVDAIEEDGTKA